MDEPNNKLPDNLVFDPLSIFPSRIRDKVFTAHSLERGDGGSVGGATLLDKGIVYIPTGNNYYDRTIRIHEALHAIYFPACHRPTILDQALEDARIHTLANLSGPTRDDELALAYQDLKQGNNPKSVGSKQLDALIALRSAAILHSHGEKVRKPAQTQLTKLCAKVGPDYHEQMMKALGHIQVGDMPAAEKILLPFFGTPKERKEPPKEKVSGTPSPYSRGEGPSIAPPEELTQEEIGEEVDKILKDEEEESKEDFDIPDAIDPKETFTSADKVKSQEDKDQEEAIELSKDPVAKVDYGDGGKVTKEAKEILSKHTQETLEYKKRTLPTMYIHTLYANDRMSTTIGENGEKNSSSGYLIDAKRLAMTVGNPVAKIFRKTMHYNGGTVLMDASGSMSITPEKLEKLCQIAPLATIAFYNGHNRIGNLWIYAYKMHRAKDLSAVNQDYYNKFRWGGGNTVDFPALQWLLQQAEPRIFLTDVCFCGGGYAADNAAVELFNKCKAQKKLIHVQSFPEMEKMLANGGINRL